jgi:uncharacterized protein
MSDPSSILAVFAKEPRAGQVKTRLARETSPEWATDVALAFLRDTLERCAGVQGERMLVFTPAEARDFFVTQAAGRYRLVPQADGDLGQRLKRFVIDHLTQGTERIIILGTDSPTLPLEYVTRAFELLLQYDVVLGPATDGGYYLLGCTGRVPPIFDRITWGEASVLAQTTERLQAASWSFTLLPPWYDVDTLADWRKLPSRIAAIRAAGLDPQAPRTEAMLESE